MAVCLKLVLLGKQWMGRRRVIKTRSKLRFELVLSRRKGRHLISEFNKHLLFNEDIAKWCGNPRFKGVYSLLRRQVLILTTQVI